VSAYFASLPAPNVAAPPDAAPEDTELGGKVAQAIHCTNCHGDHLEGVDNIPRLAGQREDYLYKALRDFKSGARTSVGAAGMAEVVYPLGDLEMKALAHYLSQLR
jgi:cytochrome c553